MKKLSDYFKDHIYNEFINQFNESLIYEEKKIKVKNVKELYTLCCQRLIEVIETNNDILDLTDIDVSGLTEIKLFCDYSGGSSWPADHEMEDKFKTLFKNREVANKLLSNITIDVTGWNTKRCKSLVQAFTYYHISTWTSDSSFKEFKGLDTLDVSNVKDFGGAFGYCNHTKITGIDNWNTAKGTEFNYMFTSCTNLDINVSKWDISNGTNFAHMFCDSNIRKTDIGDNFKKRFTEIFNQHKNNNDQLIKLFDDFSHNSKYSLAMAFHDNHWSFGEKANVNTYIPDWFKEMADTAKNAYDNKWQEDKKKQEEKEEKEKAEKQKRNKLPKKEWTAKEVKDFVSDIISNNYVDEDNYNYEENNSYYDDAADELKQWYRNNKKSKFECYTSTGDYWGWDITEYIECKEDDIEDMDGPEDGCGLSITSSTIEGKAMQSSGMNGDYFDFKFEEI